MVSLFVVAFLQPFWHCHDRSMLLPKGARAATKQVAAVHDRP